VSFRLTLREGVFLVGLARRAVEEHLKSGKTIKPPGEASAKLRRPCGVFVTLNKVVRGRRELRGCIGFPYPTMPLVEAVIDSAVSAATGDPRFHPVSPDELAHIVFEVSVLTPPELIEVESPKGYPSEVKIGRDGLIVERGPYKGLLLPQVPVEWGWGGEEFLCQCCMKAGLPPDCWLARGTRVYRFEAVIFEEESPGGEVRPKEIGGE